ncbi:hypothetical protein HQ393_08515 [Chitinibacter bivalviorum]|uniref:Uncharacterized protein n=1 Tax=Chitinibacter bivalviorum TaxID=2739434 RepID=A0A7H9BJ10_9NEIS|nr:hypothetical protein [Chitinibacter bivalviorum]QLG88286.1 hypothetical protein HQ393_08515 [Chitinibacter bivalviorum]
MSIHSSTLNQVYYKLPRGLKAIHTRDDSNALNAQQRRLLILIDGERTVADLMQMLGTVELIASLQLLNEQGYIGTEPSRLSELSLTPTPAAATETTRTIDPERMEAVKQLMLSSSQQCLGLMAKPLIREIEEIRCEKTLKTTLARWNMALRESRTATQHADQFLKAAKTLLS